jgi:exonuclease SbcD
MTVFLQTKHGPINIVGIPWPTRNNISLSQVSSSSSSITDYISQAVVQIIKDHAQKLDPSIPAVLAGHLTVSNGIFSGSEKRAVYGTDPLFMPSQLAIEPFDYVALGHLHRHQNLNPHGIPIVYAGSIERVDFGERKEDKGFCLVSIGTKQNAQYQFIKVPMRPFIQIEVTLNSEQEQTEQLVAAIKTYDITDAIVKILYQLQEGQKDHVDLKVIQQACDHAMDLVGIIPIHTIAPRTKRLQSMHVSMDTRSLLNIYFDTKTDLKGRKEILLDKTMALLDEEVDEC